MRWFLFVLGLGVLSARAEFEFSTIAGFPVGYGGSADGTNSSARFDSPISVAVDGNSNLYVADYFNYTIRKVSPGGTNWVVTTIAGSSGNAGVTDGTNLNALFSTPTSVAVDSQGNVFVADYLNHTIRRLQPLGTNWASSTIAGLAKVSGDSDGTNSDARFYLPRGVAVDASGNLFVADVGNSTIRKIVPAGTNWVVSTIAGLATNYGSADGLNSDARFYWPAGIAVATNGVLFVADYANNTIRKLTPQGTNWFVTTIAGDPNALGSDNGTNAQARFNNPTSVAVAPDGCLFVADSQNDSIRKISPEGTNWVVTTVGGSAGNPGSADGTNQAARFRTPQGIAVDRFGNLFVADTANNTIRFGKLLALDCPAPVILGIGIRNSTLSITWRATPGRTYQPQSANRPSQIEWDNVGLPVTATNVTMVTTDAISVPQRFYRVVLLP